VSRAYNFTLTGAGAYTFQARNLFYIVGANNKPVPLYANVVDAHTTKLSGKLAVSRPAISRRATYVGCDTSQQSDLVGAASQAQSYAADAFSYVPLSKPMPAIVIFA
jgi:peptidyl-Lys metalloendopeptidase